MGSLSVLHVVTGSHLQLLLRHHSCHCFTLRIGLIAQAVRSLRNVAEERAGRKCGGLRVLNSYWVAQDWPLEFTLRTARCCSNLLKVSRCQGSHSIEDSSG